jgi:hypothetical protein
MEREQIKEWIQLIEQKWWGMILVYFLISTSVYLTIWSLVEPLNIPEKILVFDSSIDRRLLHILLTLLLSCYITLILDIFNRWSKRYDLDLSYRVRQKLKALVVMKNVSFEKAYQALPAYCLALLDDAPQDEQDLLGKKIGLLYNSEGLGSKVKALLLGAALLRLVGKDVLKFAIESLGDEIMEAPISSDEKSLHPIK